MSEYYGSPTFSELVQAIATAGTETTLLTLSGKMRVRWLLVYASDANIRIKIYVDGNVIELDPFSPGYSFIFSSLYNYFGGVGTGSKLILREYDTANDDYSVECTVEFYVLEEFKVSAENPSTVDASVYIAVVYELLP